MHYSAKQDKAAHRLQGPREEASTESSMEQAIKQSVRELVRWCHNTAQDQHSKANRPMLRFHSIESRANAGARSDSANPSKMHRLSITEVISRPGRIAQRGVVQIPSRFPVAVPVRRAAAGRRAGQAPCTPRAGSDRYCTT
jgi:hypothetical protein